MLMAPALHPNERGAKRPTSRGPKPHAMPGRLVPSLLRYLRRRGGDVDGLLRRLDLPSDIESGAEVALTTADVRRILDAAATALDDPHFALQLPSVLESPKYSMAELVARSCPTVGDALRRMVRFAPVVYTPLIFSLEEGDDDVVFTHRVRGDPMAARHGNEFALASVVTLMRRWTGVPVTPKRIWFAHRWEGGGEALEAFFGTSTIEFGRAENGVAFDPATMRLPVVTNDPRMLATVEGMAERELADRAPKPDFAGTVALHVRKAMEGGAVDVNAVARRLRMSTRTMQRRLDEEGTNFRRVVDAVRRDLARQYAREGRLPLSEIAHRLGFSDVASFSRAFKRWTGESPGAFRGR